MCIYVFRRLDDEAKADFFRRYLITREMYRNFLRDVTNTIKDMDQENLREKSHIILEIAKAYAETTKRINEMDKIIQATFLD